MPSRWILLRDPALTISGVKPRIAALAHLTPTTVVVMEFMTLPSGGELEYLTAGASGRPVLLFVHGLAADGTQFAEQVCSFATDYQTVSVSLRGHGRSSAQFPPDRRTMTVLVDDLLSLLRQLEADRAHWVGNSLGGLVALHAARLMPSAVRSLTTFGTTAQLHTPKPIAAVLPVAVRLLGTTGLRKLLSSTASKDKAVARKFADMSATLTPEVYTLLSRAISDYDLTEVVRHCAAPYLLVRGEHDKTINRSLATTLAAVEANPLASVKEMAGVGHLANMEDPTGFDTMLREFLAEEPNRERESRTDP